VAPGDKATEVTARWMLSTKQCCVFSDNKLQLRAVIWTLCWTLSLPSSWNKLFILSVTWPSVVSSFYGASVASSALWYIMTEQLRDSDIFRSLMLTQCYLNRLYSCLHVIVIMVLDISVVFIFEISGESQYRSYNLRLKNLHAKCSSEMSQPFCNQFGSFVLRYSSVKY